MVWIQESGVSYSGARVVGVKLTLNLVRMSLSFWVFACGQSSDQTAAMEDAFEPEDIMVQQDTVPECLPSCSIDRCAELDGCGNSCPPCPNLANCESCALRLEATTVDAALQTATLTLSYEPEADGPTAELADLRFRLTGPATLLTADVAPAVTDSGKEIPKDRQTGEVFTVLPDGTVRILFLSTAELSPIPSGLWLTLTLRLGLPFESWDTPVTVALTRHQNDPILTPPPAEQLTQHPETTAPLALWPPDSD
ncbi:MAG: hypothetical protein ACI9OJ_004774 [Myxococcota bacterium]